MKYPDDEVVAIFRDIANRLDAQWTHGMEYPFERKTVEKLDTFLQETPNGGRR